MYSFNSPCFIMTMVGVLGSGKIWERYPASSEPACSRRATAWVSINCLSCRGLAKGQHASFHEESNRVILEIFRLPLLAFLLAICTNVSYLSLQVVRLAGIPVTKQSTSFCFSTAWEMPSWSGPEKNILDSCNNETNVVCQHEVAAWLRSRGESSGKAAFAGSAKRGRTVSVTRG